MTFAIVLNVYNHLYYGHPQFIWAEFVPQMLFMQSIFGYLVICIIYKWSVDWWALDGSGNHIRNSPPSLLNMLIYMFLTPGKVDPKDQLYPGQGPVQAFLLFVAAVCVPWMLLMKPYLLKKEHEKAKSEGYHVATEGAARVSYEEDEGDAAGGAVVAEAMDEEEEFDFSEIMIHQTIHCIEFCLNCISNTASYLRLWALSLAHARE
ncbi:V-type ATPase, V0 complex, 116kDa subunit family [Jimgerdemannia flammicorona]|uniref:V-type ATPase, V0 complex, 116kDa subunit family n=2 Tax=Jimgerdemannia flammicorona TaxID=994334 RepID=A0A433DCG3_9FUNG|nr:V-type ATPase, V0 complex, 116kDa subunit family [Jimgerdemannia flammicorona]RUS25093.1 V-type ATPase, V0 complex, 116kDa subunit family [Jimgerdemannia flammicorona]